MTSALRRLRTRSPLGWMSCGRRRHIVDLLFAYVALRPQRQNLPGLVQTALTCSHMRMASWGALIPN